ncbi:hypothetical protein [Streptomyces sp. NPDC004008]
MSLKDTAARAAVLSTLHAAIGDELKTAKRDLEDGLRAAKAETGTQKVTISLNDQQDIGTVSLVQPKAAAVITDDEKFKQWVMDHYGSEIERRFVTEVRVSFVSRLLKEMNAAGVAQWADPETGEIHEVPGIEMQGRAAYTRLTVPDDGKAAIAEAWREGRLATGGLPALAAAPSAESTDTADTAALRARIAELEERTAWLDALEAAGLDNWQGVDVAREMLAGGAE